MQSLPMQDDSLPLLSPFASFSSSYPFLQMINTFPDGSDSKESACNAEDPGSIPVSGNPLEKEMATHSSIVAWEIPWTEEPGGLQSKGSQGVGHD